MCGIAGFLNAQADTSLEGLTDQLTQMGQAIAYRGPDASDCWADPQQGIGFVHRRLSVIDLSPAGNQPMISQDQRYIIVYNGEVYNADLLRADLERAGKTTFNGHSDTEMILESIATFGVRETVAKLIGMFAFALWDRHAKALTLVRDRVGIKPLYWSLQSNVLYFASELKSLKAHGRWQGQLNRDALSGYMRHNYIAAPHTIYQATYKLQPGHILTWQVGQEAPQIEAYWSLQDVAAQSRQNQRAEADTIAQLDAILRDSVKRCMVSDVPLGAFLSGGVDSSLVAALMQDQSSQAIKTFSIGFQAAEFNEAGYAKEVAQHLGTDHTEFYVGDQEALDVVPKLGAMFDEPFADSSQIPTYLVSALTKKHVTVAMSGDGGDELFQGYSRYHQAQKLWSGLERVPKSLRHLARFGIKTMPTTVLDQLSRIRPSLTGDRLHKAADWVVQDRLGLYRQFLSHWAEPDDLVLGGEEPKGMLWQNDLERLLPLFNDQMRYLDTLTYMPDDILTKVDRTSMAVSLEARVPLLDHRVIEFAWGLPSALLTKDGTGKWPLRQVLYRYVPSALIDRPKMGFGVPLGEWLRGPLKDWAADLLDPIVLEQEGFLNAKLVAKKWQEHQAGTRNWQYHLWDVLMFQAWKQAQ